MAPLVKDSRLGLGPTALVDDNTLRSPLSRAIDEFLLDIGEKQDGKNPFLKELSQQQAQLLKTASRTNQTQVSADALRSFVTQLENKRNAGRGTRLLARVGPFIEALQKLMLTCENVVQASPFGVSVAFAGARIVLELASKMQAYLDQVVDAMALITINLKCYEKFAAAYENSTDIQDLLVSSYKRIIEFWCDTSHKLSQNSFKLVIKGIARSLDKEVRKAVDGLTQDRYAVQALVHATGAEQWRHEKEDAQKQGIERWIKGMSDEHVDVRVDLQDRLERRQDDTCQWVFEDQQFQEWRNAREQSVLWYNAPPGSGKSIVASTIVDYLKKEGENVVYFFFSFNSSLRQQCIHGLRSLALQLLTLAKTIPDIVVKLWENEMQNYATTLNVPRTACHVVSSLMSQCPRPVYVVIDGLDECHNEDLALNVLEYLVRMPSYTLVKWLFTSRDHPGIRAAMQRCRAVEIQADNATISRDIRTYFSKNIDCESCIDGWAEGEDNFLYATFVCETLQGKGVSCDDEIREKLAKFPKDLNGYYVRSLERLSSQTDELQELARRTFLILTAAHRSVSSDELLDFLAIRPNSRDHKTSRMPSKEAILEVCGPLVVIDKPSQDASPDNPTFKLCHKTAQDFFCQDSDKLKNVDLRKFFLTVEQADEELGMNCLTYLQYDRYQKPGLDLPTLLSMKPVPKDHAFLRYTATFWTHHFMSKPQSAEAVEAMMNFIKSPAFWTCTAVQAHVSPYMYGTFVGHKSGGFNMHAKGSGADLFGVPLPAWLDTQSAEGLLLERSMYCFVDEWREVMTTNPHGLELCPPLRKFDVSCHLMPLQKQRSMQVAHVADMTGIADALLGEVHLLSVAFRGKTVWADVMYRLDGEGSSDRLRRVEVPLFSKTKKPSASVIDIPIERGDSTWMISAVRQAGRPEKVEAWSLDTKTLSLKRMAASGHSYPEEHVPLSFSGETFGKRRGAWEVVSTQNLEPDAPEATSMRILHATWRKQRAMFHMKIQDGETEEDSDNETDISDESSEAPEPGDTADDTESDDDSNVESITENDSSETEYESSPEEGPTTDCLVMVPYSGQPLWHTWSSSPKVWSKVTAAMHPVLPIVAVTHTGRQLEVINIPTWTKKTKHLPEPADLQEAPPASLRELRFSPCGAYLHLLSISFVPYKAETTAYITVSTFDFNHEGNSSDTLLRKGLARTCSYTFGELLKDMPVPLALTYWSGHEVVIALPPLTCDPKILRISLGNTEVDGAIWTLRRPIYFPTSTPKRSPRLLYRREGQDVCGYIYLSLDSLNPRASSQRGDDQSDSSKEPSRVSPPVVLRWKDGWRSWEDEEDGRASDLKRGLSVWKMLKGGFIDSDKSFNVVTRSGADWARKAYLSCS